MRKIELNIFEAGDIVKVIDDGGAYTTFREAGKFYGIPSYHADGKSPEVEKYYTVVKVVSHSDGIKKHSLYNLICFIRNRVGDVFLIDCNCLELYEEPKIDWA